MVNKLTPEEKLLKLIRKKKDKINLFLQTKEYIKSLWRKLLHSGFYVWTNRLFLFQRKKPEGKLYKPPIFYINKFLFVCVAVLAVYFIKEASSLKGLREIDLVRLRRSSTAGVEEKDSSAKRDKSLSFYLRRIGSKNVFKIIESEEPKTVPKVQDDKPGLQELVNQFMLSGIVSDGERFQAVITDRRKNQTFFVYQGDFIGNIKVEKIFENKVVVSLENDQAEIGMR